MCQGVRVTRSRRELFPLPSRWSSDLRAALLTSSSFDGLGSGERIDVARWCWCDLSVRYLNYLHGRFLGVQKVEGTVAQKDLLKAVEATVKQVLVDDCSLSWFEEDIEDDFKKKTLSYEGEEITKAEELSIERVLPALPPPGHGGAIDICKWVSGKTLWYLQNPLACIERDVGQALPRLQAKVHIARGERLELAKLLVDRNICRWTRESDVLRYRNEMVLNGLFGVEKSSLAPSGKTTQRCIMNLIPSNGVLKTLEGRVHRLPSVCQWMNICVEGGEEIRISQSDMVSAFYLFSLPPEWSRLLCFNLKFLPSELGLEEAFGDEPLYLSCKVLPMGWASAVGVMQFVAEEVLLRGGLEAHRQISRTAPLPNFLTQCMDEANVKRQSWWHVYLDNYAGAERALRGQPDESIQDQVLVERLWADAGIVSSKKKAVSGGSHGIELGAFIGGSGQWIGGSPERLLKTAKATLWLLENSRLNRKRLQIILGRWVFILQFRRAGMSHFEEAWRVIAEKRVTKKVWSEMKLELLLMVFGSLLCHTWLGAKIDNAITCSDASMSGGAVAVSEELTSYGNQYLQHLEAPYRPLKIPVVLLTLFNGIGGSCRSYDVAGLKVQNIIAVDIHKPANRVTSRRWGEAVIEEDIRNLTKKRLEELLLQCEDFDEVHVWAGFPCVDLSSAKAGRLNLEGEKSSLIYEVVRVLRDLEELYPKLHIHFVVENVASMDGDARDSISKLLGVKPYRVDPCNQAPMSRPRYCWTSLEVFPVDGIWISDRGAYFEMEVAGMWPSGKQWLDEGSAETHPGVIYPTCMKSIKRSRPPPRPAGIERTDELCRARWTQDEYRFPPYQYKHQYLIEDSRVNHCRLLNSLEREILMGYGAGHTEVAWSASQVKQNPIGFEDERNSLIGDSFSIYSFMIFAAFGGYKWMQRIEVEKMNNRVGLPPGVALNIDFMCPMQREYHVPLPHGRCRDVHEFNRHLLQRTNHTGSDIRILTGEIMCPKKYPRQSVQSRWWRWRPVFASRWKFEEHINALEVRAVYLALLWKCRERGFCSRRIFHATDSYVAMSILSKGRTSSRKLQPLIRKISALLLAGQTQLVLAHIDSFDNPTDEASRYPEKKKA